MLSRYIKNIHTHKDKIKRFQGIEYGLGFAGSLTLFVSAFRPDALLDLTALVEFATYAGFRIYSYRNGFFVSKTNENKPEEVISICKIIGKREYRHSVILNVHNVEYNLTHEVTISSDVYERLNNKDEIGIKYDAYIATDINLKKDARILTNARYVYSDSMMG